MNFRAQNGRYSCNNRLIKDTKCLFLRKFQRHVYAQNKGFLTLCNSFSISVARMTRGPRTAYSIVLMHGFKLSIVMVCSHVEAILAGVKLIEVVEATAVRAADVALVTAEELSRPISLNSNLPPSSKVLELHCFANKEAMIDYSLRGNEKSARIKEIFQEI